MTSEVQSKYFKSDEAKETLVGMFKPTDQLTYRIFQYKTGATYQGQWKGGLRHNKGVMIWPDSARYDGEW